MNRKSPRFSIIIPACEVAPYAAETIASVKTQGFTDFECLVMNEKSRDRTAEVLAEAIDGDPRFHIYQLPVSGSASVSRNLGIQYARGDYLFFLDGDDRMPPDALERISAFAAQYGDPDLIIGEYRVLRMEKNGDLIPQPEAPEAGIDSTPIPGWRLLARMLHDGSYRSATWRNVYRREFLVASGLRQTPGRRHQDDEWTPQVYNAAGTAMASGIQWYIYLKREGSVTTKASERSVDDAADNLSSVFRFWRTNALPAPLKREIAHWHFYAVFRFFSPAWSRLFNRRHRMDALRRVLLKDGNLWTAWAMIFYAHRADRLFFIAMLTALFVPGTAGAAEYLHRKIYRALPVKTAGKGGR
ncbi:MAG: glycosyltransferase [Victivallaceae bacterium]|nr:glycosyltransferase [Victivallaceae bacterium]